MSIFKILICTQIHTINLTGTHKKKSVQERLDYANSILVDIVDSAERPLTGNMWWAKSEEPWQTLAACIEVRNAVASGDPASYVSKFPLHQDGSCNGLQHYAALGRDLVSFSSYLFWTSLEKGFQTMQFLVLGQLMNE